MSNLNKAMEILAAFLYGSLAYLVGWIISIPFDHLRDNTVLLPRVSLITVGLGGLLIGYLINKGKTEGILRFSVAAIISYLGVILVNFVAITIELDQGSIYGATLFRVSIPTIIFTILLGIQIHGMSSFVLLLGASIFSSIPYSLVAIVYSLSINNLVGFESVWMYISIGAATATSLKYLSMKDKKAIIG